MHIVTLHIVLKFCFVVIYSIIISKIFYIHLHLTQSMCVKLLRTFASITGPFPFVMRGVLFQDYWLCVVCGPGTEWS